MSPADVGRIKQESYAALYALDESDSDPLDDGLSQSMATLKRKRATPNSASFDSSRHTQEQQTVNKETFLLPRSVTAPAVIHLPEPSASSDVGKGRRKRGQQGEIAEVKASEKLFSGLLLYFFPDNDKSPARKARIKKAVDNGAVWVRVWDEKVSLVVVDRNMKYGQIIKHLKIDAITSSIPVVKEDYVADCISFESILDPHQRIYKVEGHDPEPSAAAQHPQPAQRSLNLKPAKKDVQARPPQTPSQKTATSSVCTPTSQGVTCQGPSEQIERSSPHPIDALTAAINEARTLQHLPLDDEDEGSRPSSSDGNVGTISGPSKQPQYNPPPWQKGFQCMKSHTGKDKDNPNAATIMLLQEMATHYDQIKDTWRPMAYRKAIATLNRQTIKICTKEEAEKLPSVGTRIAAKIEEIVYTNHLRRLENARTEPTDKAMQLFLGVHGVGFAQGMRFIAQGFRTLDDLRAKASLTAVQKIGLQRYDDFNSRIPRDEVKRHGDIVIAAARRIDPGLSITIMGSYRRGAATSGDIDIVITHPTWPMHKLRNVVFDRLRQKLEDCDFIKCTLAETNKIDGTKWHGASCLPESKIWRRLDFLLVPATEFGAAMIYFTGNDIFNRSMRLLASKKGMRLNQRGLYKDVMRGKGREKLTEGELVEGRDEKKIFAALGVPWRKPEERIC